MDYIKDNFNELMLFFLRKNQRDFGENNIMEHPRLILESINTNNVRVNCPNREDSYVVYRYFSTVIYVAIAYANGLTREIDNYRLVEGFFSNKK